MLSKTYLGLSFSPLTLENSNRFIAEVQSWSVFLLPGPSDWICCDPLGLWDSNDCEMGWTLDGCFVP